MIRDRAMHRDTNVRCDRSYNSVVADVSEPENLKNPWNYNRRNPWMLLNPRNRVGGMAIAIAVRNGLEAESENRIAATSPLTS